MIRRYLVDINHQWNLLLPRRFSSIVDEPLKTISPPSFLLPIYLTSPLLCSYTFPQCFLSHSCQDLWKDLYHRIQSTVLWDRFSYTIQGLFSPLTIRYALSSVTYRAYPSWNKSSLVLGIWSQCHPYETFYPFLAYHQVWCFL